MMEFPESTIQEVLELLGKHTDLSSSGHLVGLNSHDALSNPTVESLEANAYVFESLLVGIRRRRNFLMPIYQIPPEIMGIIFLEVQDAEGIGYERYQAIKRLAGVSSHWFSTILSNPRLWTIIDSRFQHQFMKCIVQRSKCAPLDIHLYEAEYLVLESILDLLTPHIARWRTLHILSCKFPALLRRIGDLASIPQLESFEVTASYKAEVVPDFIRSGAPRLHTLSVLPFSLPLEAPVLTSVRRLEFTPAVEGFELSPQQWQAMFCSFPQLEVIHVDGIPGMKPKEASFPSFRAFLPNLQKISLVMLPISTIGALISSICVAPNVYPQIEIRNLRTVNENEGMDVLFPESPQPQSLLWLIRSIREMSVVCRHRNSHMDVTAGGGPDEINLHFKANDGPRSSAGDILEALVSTSGLPNLESLCLEGEPVLGGAPILRTLRRFPRLKKLDMISPNQHPQYGEHHDNLKDICRVLSCPSTWDDGVLASWPLPELVELGIASLDGLGAVLPLIEARFGLSESSPVTELPASLKVLRLETPPNVGMVYKRPLDPAHARRLHGIMDERGGEVEITI